jgi:mannose-1-phosphate guanylyltransferase
VYVIERRVLDHVPETGFQDIKENLIPKLHRAGERVVAYESDGVCPRVLNAQTYLAVNQWVLERRVREDGEGEVLAHPTAWVEPGARLVGPVQLGPRVHVHSGATIVGPTSIGPESTVGRNALVARSVVWNRCEVGEGAVVHGCVVGNDAVVAPATRLFNVVHRQEQSPPSPLRVSLRGRAKTAAPPGAYPGSALP